MRHSQPSRHKLERPVRQHIKVERPPRPPRLPRSERPRLNPARSRGEWCVIALGGVATLAGAVGVLRPSSSELQNYEALEHFQWHPTAAATERGMGWYFEAEAEAAALLIAGVGAFAGADRHRDNRQHKPRVTTAAQLPQTEALRQAAYIINPDQG